ncbi:TPA: NERD domain-containing protein, partial [Vibrio cholerae]|nr:NERD domain-containing protein [Vibrio cholerae]
PTFSDNELQNIKNFLIEAHKNPLIEDKKFTNKFNKPDNITHQTEKK